MHCICAGVQSRSGSLGEQLRQPQPRPRVARTAAHVVPKQLRGRAALPPPSPPAALVQLQPALGLSPPGSNSLLGRGLGRAGAGCSPGRGTPQCLLSNHLLPPCQEPSAHKQCRAPVRSTCLRDKPGKEITSIFVSLGLRRSFICWHFPGVGSGHTTIHLRSQTLGSQLPFLARGVSPNWCRVRRLRGAGG